MSHISEPPIFSIACIYKYNLYRGVCLSSLEVLSGGLVWGFLSGRFCPGCFLSVPLLSEYIRYNRKLNITFSFRFHMCETNFRSVTSYQWRIHREGRSPPPLESRNIFFILEFMQK